jgi:hypothetical protein
MAARGTDLIPVVQKSYDLCAGLYTIVMVRLSDGKLNRETRAEDQTSREVTKPGRAGVDAAATRRAGGRFAVASPRGGGGRPDRTAVANGSRVECNSRYVTPSARKKSPRKHLYQPAMVGDLVTSFLLELLVYPAIYAI